jgi:hypothetical protein
MESGLRPVMTTPAQRRPGRRTSRRPDREQNDKVRDGPAAIDQVREGNQNMRSDVKDRISNRTPLMSRPAAVRALIGHADLAPQCELGFLDDLSMTSDANMAWLLAIAADVCLTGHERTMTFVELGCGENHLAVERILNAVMSSRMTLPVAIFDRLTRWLDGYVGSPEEPRLRTMLAQIGHSSSSRFHCAPNRRSVAM